MSLPVILITDSKVKNVGLLWALNRFSLPQSPIRDKGHDGIGRGDRYDAYSHTQSSLWPGRNSLVPLAVVDETECRRVIPRMVTD